MTTPLSLPFSLFIFFAMVAQVFMGLSTGLAQESPVVDIPFLQKKVELDGHMEPGEWEDAAIIHPAMTINQASSHENPVPRDPEVQTAIYLKYDDTNLYAAAVCEEPRPDYPEAYPRPHDGNFTQDDSVQIVLGLVDPNTVVREVMDMGGYPGAMGTPATEADNYYQFTVNSVDARQRAWNERALPNPRFESAVGKKGNQWTIEYKIPFESFGANSDIVKGIVNSRIPLFLNAFRYRSPEMIGWYVPRGYGGYRPMPLGRASLLPPTSTAQADKRTIEPPAKLASPDESAPLESQVSIGYYPLQGSVIGIIDGPLPDVASEATHAVLKVSGLPDTMLALRKIELSDLRGSGKNRSTSSTEFRRARQLVITPLTAGTQPMRKAELAFYDSDPSKNKDAKVLHVVSRDLPAVTAPEWHGTDAGAEYSEKKISPPWTKPVVDADARTVRLVDKTLRFGAFGLPESVVVDHNTEPSPPAEILDGPANITLVVEGEELHFSTQTPVVSADGNTALVLASATATAPSGPVTLESRVRVDFDGFTEVKLRLVSDSLSLESISRLAIRIPVSRETARYVHRVLVQQIAELDGFGYQGPAGPIWTGNERGGLAFSFDTPLFFSKDERRQVRLVEEKDRVWIELNLVDGPGQYFAEEGSGRVLRFFLHPTPTKPAPRASYRSSTSDHPRFEVYSDWQGFPDLAKIPDDIKPWAAGVRSEGRIPLLYTCQGLALDAPWFAEFREDMEILPSWRFYRRSMDPGKGIDVFATNKSGPEGDLQLWAFRKFADEVYIGGVWSDGMFTAWNDDSPGPPHGAGRPVTSIEWESDSFVPSRITGQRNFLKRLRGIFHETGRPLGLTAHTGGGIDANTLSFADYYIEGEQLQRFPGNYAISPAVYHIGYDGRPWGMRGVFWIKRWVRSNGPYWALTWALLHNTEIRENPFLEQVLSHIDPVKGSDPDFIPWWESNAYVGLDSRTNESRASLYSSNGEAIVVVANTGLADDSVKVDLHRLFASSGDTPADQVEELLTGNTFKLEDGSIMLDLPARRSVALRVVSHKHLADQSEWASTNAPGEWKLSVGAVPGLLSDGQAAIVLTSPSDGVVSATYTAHPLSPSAAAQFLIHPKDNFRLSLGETVLAWNKTQGWSLEDLSKKTNPSTPTTMIAMSGQTIPDSPQRSPWSADPGILFNPALQTTNQDGSPRFASLRLDIRGRVLNATLDDQPLIRGLQLRREASTGRSLDLSFSTQNGGSFSFVPLSLSSVNKPLYEGGLTSVRVAAVSPEPSFDLTDVPPDQWTVKSTRGVTHSVGTLDDKPALAIRSGQNRAVATLNQTVGDNFSAIFKFDALPTLGLLRIGPVSLRLGSDPTRYGPSRWVLDGPLTGWASGVGPRRGDTAASPQPKVPKGSPAVLRISMKNGVLDVAVNDELLVRGLAFDIPKAGNIISVETWGGSGTTFRLLRLSSEPSQIYAPVTTEHPVL